MRRRKNSKLLDQLAAEQELIELARKTSRRAARGNLHSQRLMRRLLEALTGF